MQRCHSSIPWILAFVVLAGTACTKKSTNPKDKAFQPRLSAVSEHRFLIEADREDDSCQEVSDGVTECIWEEGDTTCRQGVSDDGSFLYQHCTGPGWQYSCNLSDSDIDCELTNGDSICTDTWSVEFELIDTDCDFGHYLPQDSCEPEENNTRRCTFEDDGYDCSALLQEDGSLISMECIRGPWRSLCNHNEAIVECELYMDDEYACTDVWTPDGEPVDMGCDRYFDACPRGDCNYFDECNGNNCPCDVLAQDCEAANHRCWPYGPNAADGQCFVSGERTLGQPCVEPPVGEPESCGAGLLCISEIEDLQVGVCVAFCATSQDCPGEQNCVSLDFDGTATDFGICWRPEAEPLPSTDPPATACSILNQDCNADLLCVTNEDYPDHGVCVEPGTGTVTLSRRCTSSTDCSPGLGCFANVGGPDPETNYFLDTQSYLDYAGYCLELCPAGDDDACISGSCGPVAANGLIRQDVGVCTD